MKREINHAMSTFFRKGNDIGKQNEAISKTTASSRNDEQFRVHWKRLGRLLVVCCQTDAAPFMGHVSYGTTQESSMAMHFHCPLAKPTRYKMLLQRQNYSWLVLSHPVVIRTAKSGMNVGFTTGEKALRTSSGFPC